MGTVFSILSLFSFVTLACNGELERSGPRLPGERRVSVFVAPDEIVSVIEDGKSLGTEYGVIATVQKKTKYFKAGDSIVLVYPDRPYLLATPSRHIGTVYRGLRIYPADESLSYVGRATLRLPVFIVLGDRAKSQTQIDMHQTAETSESHDTPHFGSGAEVDRGPRRSESQPGPDSTQGEFDRSHNNRDPSLGEQSPHFGG